MARMEVAIPNMEFDFKEAHPFPYLSAPSTPKRFGDYFMSAPTSPSRVAEFYTKEDDFAFGFSVQPDKGSWITADELFDGGKIKPMKPPPALKFQVEKESTRSPLLTPKVSSPRSPIAQGKKIIKQAFFPRRKKDPDSFGSTQKRNGNERGRERVLTASYSRRGARSLSPYRVTEQTWEEEHGIKQESFGSKDSIPSISSSSSNKSSSRKWSLKDFLLFRSASEGHGSDKDPFKKYSAAALFRKNKNHDQDIKNARRKVPVSAHELHYTLNKAASEDLKKKTFLPYKQGILGRLAFNPAVHAISNSFGSPSRS